MSPSPCKSPTLLLLAGLSRPFAEGPCIPLPRLHSKHNLPPFPGTCPSVLAFPAPLISKAQVKQALLQDALPGHLRLRNLPFDMRVPALIPHIAHHRTSIEPPLASPNSNPLGDSDPKSRARSPSSAWGPGHVSTSRTVGGEKHHLTLLVDRGHEQVPD